MAVEIERKFLVLNSDWRVSAGPGLVLRQGYLAQAGGVTVRVRCTPDAAYLTVKGPRDGLARPEFEYEIPVLEGESMLANLAVSPPLRKARHPVMHDGMIWEVDVFEGPHEGLVLAEVELEHSDQVVTLPPWVGKEVTSDRRYRGSALARAGFVPQREVCKAVVLEGCGDATSRG